MQKWATDFGTKSKIIVSNSRIMEIGVWPDLEGHHPVLDVSI